MTFEEKQAARYAELTEQSDAIKAKLQPLQDKLAELVAKEQDDGKLRSQIVAMRGPLFDIEQERAFIARGLKKIPQ